MFPKEFVLFGLFFALALEPMNAEQQKISKQITFSATDTVTVPIRNRFYTILKNETHIQINCIDKNLKKWMKKCTITIDSTNDHIEGKIQETLHENVLAIWGVKTSVIVDSTRRTNYTFLLIKPLACGYDSLTLPVHEMPANDPPQLPKIEVYGSGFNVFYNNTACSPCLIDRTGYLFTPLQQQAIDNAKPVAKTRLFGGQVDYIYAHNFDNGTAVAKLFTRNYEIIQRKIFNHSIDAADSKYSFLDEDTHISFCYGNGTQRVLCGQFDDDLKLRFIHPVLLLPQYFASSLAVKVDEKGRTLVGLIQSPLDQSNGPHKINAHIFDKSGKVIKTIDFGEIEQKYQYNKLCNWIFYQNYKEKQYCVHVVQMEKPDDRNTNETIKCIDFDPFKITDVSFDLR